MEKINVNLNEIKRVIKNYNSLSDKEKKIVDEKINSAWHKVVDKFFEVCQKDQELNRCIDACDEYNDVIFFNLEDEFSSYAYTVNEFDPEFSEDIYEFDPKKLDDAKHTAQNIDRIRVKIQNEITRIKNARIAINRQARIEKYEKLLHQKERVAKHYNECMKKQALKKEYLEKRDTMFLPYKRKRDELLHKHALEVLEPALNSVPALACVRHTSLISSSKHDRYYSTDALNDISNEVRDNANLALKGSLEINTIL